MERIKVGRHVGIEMCRGWDMWQAFAKCGYSVYGRVHFSRLNHGLRKFLAERGFMGMNGNSYVGAEERTSTEFDTDDDSDDPSFQPHEGDSDDDEGGAPGPSQKKRRFTPEELDGNDA